MSIRFYTTSVHPDKTAREIQEVLAEAGARHVRTSYKPEGGSVESVEFTLEIDGEQVGFRLAPDVEGMKRALEEDESITASSRQTTEHAERVAWRNLKAWLEAQLAFRAANQAEIDQILLGWGITPSGDTIYEQIVENKKLLEA